MRVINNEGDLWLFLHKKARMAPGRSLTELIKAQQGLLATYKKEQEKAAKAEAAPPNGEHAPEAMPPVPPELHTGSAPAQPHTGSKPKK